MKEELLKLLCQKKRGKRQATSTLLSFSFFLIISFCALVIAFMFSLAVWLAFMFFVFLCEIYSNGWSLYNVYYTLLKICLLTLSFFRVNYFAVQFKTTSLLIVACVCACASACSMSLIKWWQWPQSSARKRQCWAISLCDCSVSVVLSADGLCYILPCAHLFEPHYVNLQTS